MLKWNKDEREGILLPIPGVRAAVRAVRKEGEYCSRRWLTGSEVRSRLKWPGLNLSRKKGEPERGGRCWREEMLGQVPTVVPRWHSPSSTSPGGGPWWARVVPDGACREAGGEGGHFLGQAHSSGPVLIPEPSRGSIGRRKRVREAPPTRQGSETEEAASTPSTPQRVRVHLSA